MTFGFHDNQGGGNLQQNVSRSTRTDPLNLSQSCTKQNPLSPLPFLGASDPNRRHQLCSAPCISLGTRPAAMPSTALLLERRGHAGGTAPASGGAETDHETPGKLIKEQGSSPASQISGNATVSVPNNFDISCSHAHLEA